jgi:hypothetical protein
VERSREKGGWKDGRGGKGVDGGVRKEGGRMLSPGGGCSDCDGKDEEADPKVLTLSPTPAA